MIDALCKRNTEKISLFKKYFRKEANLIAAWIHWNVFKPNNLKFTWNFHAYLIWCLHIRCLLYSYKPEENIIQCVQNVLPVSESIYLARRQVTSKNAENIVFDFFRSNVSTMSESFSQSGYREKQLPYVYKTNWWTTKESSSVANSLLN